MYHITFRHIELLMTEEDKIIFNKYYDFGLDPDVKVILTRDIYKETGFPENVMYAVVTEEELAASNAIEVIDMKITEESRMKEAESRKKDLMLSIGNMFSFDDTLSTEDKIVKINQYCFIFEQLVKVLSEIDEMKAKEESKAKRKGQ